LVLVPTATIIAALVNPTNPNVETLTRDLQTAARALGQETVVVNARTAGDIDALFARLVQQRVGALLVDTDAFFFSRRNQLIALAK
jgi:putative tryptophan/tyrosine transport system substrate-binding protein